jgi:hypothetical protein
VHAKDSFTNRKTTDAFRELQKRLPADHETMKTLTKTSMLDLGQAFCKKLKQKLGLADHAEDKPSDAKKEEKIKDKKENIKEDQDAKAKEANDQDMHDKQNKQKTMADFADDAFVKALIARLSEPDLRDEVIAALPDDCVEQCRNLQFDLYPRMLLRKLAAADIRQKMIETLKKDHKAAFVNILLADAFKDAFVDSLGFGHPYAVGNAVYITSIHTTSSKRRLAAARAGRHQRLRPRRPARRHPRAAGL